MFVTNKHVIEDARQVPTVITVNGYGVGRLILKTEGEWQNHPDNTVDLTGICVAENPGSNISSFGIEDLFDENDNLIPGSTVKRIGPGDEVFFPGLFIPVNTGDTNIPIVRYGNLMTAGSHPVPARYGVADFYLVEARSIGGISGSPVWVREIISIRALRDETNQPVTAMGVGYMKLLGIVQTHWDTEDINKYDFKQDSKRGVNAGIALVIPAKRLAELIAIPQLLACRNTVAQRIFVRFRPTGGR